MKLIDFLNSAELYYRDFYSPLTPAWMSVQNRDIQCFAYHKDDLAGLKNKTPVVCIGANYATGPGNVEKRCASNLNRWRTNYLKARSTLLSTTQPSLQDEWVDRAWSSSPFPTLPDDQTTFFLMTNLCPWITQADWSELTSECTTSLVQRAKKHDYPHLKRLFAYLDTHYESFVIIGHGINDNILPHLLDYLRKEHPSHAWIQYANLTYFQPAPRWCDKTGKFVFPKK